MNRLTVSQDPRCRRGPLACPSFMLATIHADHSCSQPGAAMRKPTWEHAASVVGQREGSSPPAGQASSQHFLSFQFDRPESSTRVMPQQAEARVFAISLPTIICYIIGVCPRPQSSRSTMSPAACVMR
jgi:hypothetical protein